MEYNQNFAMCIDIDGDLEKRVMALQKFSSEVLENAGIEEKIIKRPAYIFPHKNRSAHA